MLRCVNSPSIGLNNKLAVEDMYGENLLLMHRGWSHDVDELRDDIWENHHQIVHPLLKIIPVEWEHTIPYGLLHSPNPSGTVQRFLSAVQKTMQA